MSQVSVRPGPSQPRGGLPVAAQVFTEGAGAADGEWPIDAKARLVELAAEALFGPERAADSHERIPRIELPERLLEALLFRARRHFEREKILLTDAFEIRVAEASEVIDGIRYGGFERHVFWQGSAL